MMWSTRRSSGTFDRAHDHEALSGDSLDDRADRRDRDESPSDLGDHRVAGAATEAFVHILQADDPDRDAQRIAIERGHSLGDIRPWGDPQELGRSTAGSRRESATGQRSSMPLSVDCSGASDAVRPTRRPLGNANVKANAAGELSVRCAQQVAAEQFDGHASRAASSRDARAAPRPAG